MIFLPIFAKETGLLMPGSGGGIWTCSTLPGKRWMLI